MTLFSNDSGAWTHFFQQLEVWFFSSLSELAVVIIWKKITVKTRFRLSSPHLDRPKKPKIGNAFFSRHSNSKFSITTRFISSVTIEFKHNTDEDNFNLNGSPLFILSKSWKSKMPNSAFNYDLTTCSHLYFTRLTGMNIFLPSLIWRLYALARKFHREVFHSDPLVDFLTVWEN